MSEHQAGSCRDPGVYYDLEMAKSLPVDAVRGLPKHFSLITVTETDPVTENDLVVWREDFVVGGKMAEFSLGFAITREAKQSPGYADNLRAARAGLRDSVWQEMEFIRLGVYKRRQPERITNEVTA